MSLRVLIISEDPTLDQHIIKPVVERIMVDIGRRARVELYEPPSRERSRGRGVEQALARERLSEIIEDRQSVDVFILIVDRDCHPNRSAAVQLLVQENANKLVACLAIEEVETWMLALHRSDLGVSWSEVRSDCHPKERFAIPFLKGRGWTMELGKGRRRAMRELGAQWKGLLQVCPEIESLKNDLVALLLMTE